MISDDGERPGLSLELPVFAAEFLRRGIAAEKVTADEDVRDAIALFSSRERCQRYIDERWDGSANVVTFADGRVLAGFLQGCIDKDAQVLVIVDPRPMVMNVPEHVYSPAEVMLHFLPDEDTRDWER